MQVVDSTWLVLNVLSNGRSSTSFQAAGVTKIAKSVIAPLAEHNVSVLMLSTYQTDFILVSPMSMILEQALLGIGYEWRPLSSLKEGAGGATSQKCI